LRHLNLAIRVRLRCAQSLRKKLDWDLKLPADEKWDSFLCKLQIFPEVRRRARKLVDLELKKYLNLAYLLTD